MKRTFLAALAAFFFTVSFNACASTGGSAGTKLDVPDWATNPPSEEGDAYVFVANGSDEGGDVTKAEQLAKNNALTSIVQELGVKISVESVAESKASPDTYEGAVSTLVKNFSEAKISGLKLAARFPVQKGKRVEIWLKYLYNKAALDGEKARLAEIERNKKDAVVGRIKEGDDLAAAGKYLQAVEKYVQGALAATTSDIDIADIHFANAINKARDILSRLNLVGLTNNVTTNVGTAFAKPFQIKLVYGSPETGTPVAGGNLNLSYKMKSGTSLVSKAQVITTENNGIANFEYPVPNFTGKEKIYVTLFVQPYLDTLAKVPNKWKTQVFSLEETANKNRLTLAITVNSNAKNIPLAMAVVDTDKDGNDLSRSQTAASIQENLTKSGFKITPLAQALGLKVKGLDAPEALGALKGSLGTAKRLVYGNFAISEVDTDPVLTAQARGTITVVDATTGEVLYTTTKSKRGTGNTEAIAVTNAFKELGAQIAKDLMDNLP